MFSEKKIQFEQAKTKAKKEVRKVQNKRYYINKQERPWPAMPRSMFTTYRLHADCSAKRRITISCKDLNNS